MKIKLQELENIPDNKLDIEFHEIISDLNNNTPVSGSINLGLIGNYIKIQGYAKADINLECDRCLKNYTQHINADIDETLSIHKLISDNIKEVELTSENLIDELQDNDEVDVTDIVYQSIILSLPTKNLCEQECPGSKELQALASEKTTDPRLEVLKTMFSDN